MATVNKPVLGYIQCTKCDERGTVHQAGGRKSKYLYKRCGCGCDQRNGKVAQSELYFETEWLADLKPEAPPNADIAVLDGYRDRQQKKFGQQPSQTAQDVVQPEKAEPKTEPKLTEKDKPNMGILAAGAVGLGMVFLALMGQA